jgi:hypothetical protein
MHVTKHGGHNKKSRKRSASDVRDGKALKANIDRKRGGASKKKVGFRNNGERNNADETKKHGTNVDSENVAVKMSCQVGLHHDKHPLSHQSGVDGAGGLEDVCGRSENRRVG